MTSAKLLRTTDARGVAVLAFNRPEKGNAYDAEVLDRMLAELDDCRRDCGVRVVLLRGAGRHFCVGADLKPVPEAPGGATRRAGLIDVCHALDTIGKPTVAMVQGACVGGGVAFAACCDLVLAERTSFYSIPEVRIGFAPGPLVPFFVRAIGARQLRRYGLSGDRFDAAEALRLGLVHELADSVESPEVVATAVQGFLASAPGAVAGLKRVIAEVAHTPVGEEMLQSLQRTFDDRRESDEAREGRAAFLEKRKPHWHCDP